MNVLKQGYQKHLRYDISSEHTSWNIVSPDRLPERKIGCGSSKPHFHGPSASVKELW